MRSKYLRPSNKSLFYETEAEKREAQAKREREEIEERNAREQRRQMEEQKARERKEKEAQ